MFTVMSFSFPFHLPCCGRVCVCVKRLNRRKISLVVHDITYYILYYALKQGVTGVPGGSVTNEDTSPGPVKTHLRDCGDAPGRI